jgi:hypothetical protein
MHLRSRAPLDRTAEIGALALLLEAEREIETAMAGLRDSDLDADDDAEARARLDAIQTAAGRFIAVRAELREQGLEIIFDA